MQTFNFSNKKVYAGSGIMQSDKTSEVVSLNKYYGSNSNDSNQTFNIFSKLDFIHSGILYKNHHQDRNQSLLLKYGARKLQMKAPSYSNNRPVTHNVIVPDLLFFKRSTHDISIGIMINHKFYYWPFHNVYSGSYDLTSRYSFGNDLSNCISETLNGGELRMQSVCEGYATQGLSFFSSPELYVHALLTSASNYDLSTELFGLNLHELSKVIKHHHYHNEVLDLTKASNVLQGDFDLNKFINFIDTNIAYNDSNDLQFNAFIKYLEDHNHFVDNVDELYESAAGLTMSEYLGSRSTTASTFYMLFLSIFSLLDDVELINDIFVNRVIY